MVKGYVPWHDAPLILIPDQESAFRGTGWDQWLTVKHTEHRRTRFYNPQSNGKTELANGTICCILECLVSGDWAAWEHHFTVTQVRGQVITVLHEPTSKMSWWNWKKVRLVDSEISWDGVRIRPNAQQVITDRTISFFAGLQHPPLLPQQDEIINISVNHPHKCKFDCQAPFITGNKLQDRHPNRWISYPSVCTTFNKS